MSAEQADDVLRQIQQKLEKGQEVSTKDCTFLSSLKKYWEHQLKLLRGYEKDKSKREENEQIISGWIHDIHEFLMDLPENESS